MRRVLWQTILIVAAVSLLGVGTPGVASAQGADSWSWVVTPQVWLTHIDKNGFAAPGGFGALSILFGPGGEPLLNQFRAENVEPVETIYPQWGVQIAAQKGRWTLAGAFQYVSFETQSDIVYRPDNNLPLAVAGLTLNPGEKIAQEFVDTTRIDVDLAGSYLFPDVVPNRLDVSIGLGFKLIIADATREYANLHPVGGFVAGLSPPGAYMICKQDDCSDADFRDRVETRDYLYGATIPMNATVRLSQDARWLLPINVTPFIGAESRDDNDVVYRLKSAPTATGVKVDRLDGTTFAYGVTGDVTLRYLVSDTVSFYAGGRVQYINGHEEYLAYGPMVGLSVRFGGQ